MVCFVHPPARFVELLLTHGSEFSLAAFAPILHEIQCKDIDGDPLGFCQGGALQTVSYKLMILCKDIDALLHVISLVDWPKHVKSFFFFTPYITSEFEEEEETGFASFGHPTRLITCADHVICS